jgi:hypothetical protein
VNREIYRNFIYQLFFSKAIKYIQSDILKQNDKKGVVTATKAKPGTGVQYQYQINFHFKFRPGSSILLKLMAW